MPHGYSNIQKSPLVETKGRLTIACYGKNQTRTITPQNYDRIFLFQKNRMNQLLNLINGVLN